MNWIALLGVFALALAIDAISMVWGTRNPVGAFFEAFIALSLWYGAMFGAPIAATYAGISTANRRNSTALGWIVGLAVLAICVAIPIFGGHKIPGVTRYLHIIERQHDVRE